MADESTPASPSSETPPPRTTGGNWRWEPPTAEELQKLMPGYTIEKILGRGGMGAVYRGVQTNLDRPVAIKILPPGVEKEDPSFAERFKSEARLMAKLSHPAVVGVYDFGTNLGGQLYFAMEYVDGSDVSQMIAAQGKLPPEHALAITAHVCDALQAAHELGIVHRDIKPANVLLNMKGQVKVADFGLAKVEDPGQHGLTKTGYAMGTPDFVAPEALMLGTAIDGRADLYAVGVMLYQMLTGNIPRGAFKPASVLVPGLDPRFDPIILKAMQHDREERHQNAAELRRELDVILTVPFVRNDAPVSAAIPVAQVAQAPGQRSAAQKPVGKPPQGGVGVPFGASQPARNSPPGGAAAKKPEADKSVRAPTKSKTPLFIGVAAAAAIGIGAFVMFSGGRADGPPSAAVPPQKALGGPSAPPAKPASVASATPKPASSPPTPKPAPPPASTSPSLPVSKSSEQSFPPGKWVKVFTKLEDLPEFVRKAGIKFENGWIVPGAATLSISSNKGLPANTGNLRNVGIRATIRSIDDPVQLVVRRSSNSQQYVSLKSEGVLRTVWQPEGPGLQVLNSVPIDPPIKIGTTYQLELAAVGSRLVSRLNGRLNPMVAARSNEAGGLMIYGKAPIRDIEVINLDGLPEVEALKILGLDEKGNDLRQPAAVASATPAPSVPASNASRSDAGGSKSSDPKFPPGQWVKMYSKREDLPPSLSQSEGLKWENGSFTASKNTSWRLPPEWSMQNGGIRFTAKNESKFELRIRDHGGHFYALKDFKTLVRAETSDAGMKHSNLASIQGSKTSKDEIVWEIAAVGNRIMARWDGKLIGPSLDEGIRKAPPAIANLLGTIRDIEVINLDGLSEAEALRILGVDEKGNDLRALAAKQEQQMAEQAKVVDAMAAIPELKALHEQFVKLQAERVTTPFEAEVAKLNAGYVGGIDREIANEKKAGHLDGVLALEEEKKTVAGARTPSSAAVPMTEDAGEGTRAPALKKLRGIYREAYAKIEAARAENLKALTDPLDARLKQIEATLTQQDRIEHAKTVREYREGLGKEGGAGTPARPASTGGGAATMNEAGKSARAPLKKFPPGDDRKAAEWVLSVGGSVSIAGISTRITAAADLPRGRFELVGVYLEFTSTTRPKGPIDNLLSLAGLKGLRQLTLKTVPLTEAHWEALPSMPELTGISLERTGVTDVVFATLANTKVRNIEVFNETSLTGEGIGALAASKSLERLSLNSINPSEEGLRQIGRLDTLTYLGLSGAGTRLRDEHLPLLVGLKNLDSLIVRRTALTAEALAAVKTWSSVTTLGFDMPPGSSATQVPLLAQGFPKLEVLSLEGEASWDYQPEDISALVGFSRMKSISFGSSVINDKALSGVLALPKLESLRFISCRKVTDASLEIFARHKSLTMLSLERLSNITDGGLNHLIGLKSLTRLDIIGCPELTPDAIAAFQKARPDVTVAR